MPKLSTQIVGNIGLYYVCYQLSRHGWNVMPTARNARGVDIMAYRDDRRDAVTIQVKSLSTAGPGNAGIPLGTKLNLLAGYYVICLHTVVAPECFVLTHDDAKKIVVRDKTGRRAYWLPYKGYARDQFRNAWSRVTGS